MVDALAAMKAERRIVVAGEMLELGPAGEEMHRQAGRHAADKKIDVLLGVRGLAQAAVDAAKQAGIAPSSWRSPEQAGEWLAREAREGDVVLLKASRGVKLEKALETWKAPVRRLRIEIIAGRRLIVLLAVVRQAATLFPAVSNFSLSHVPYGFRQSYRAVYRPHRGSAGHQPAARISDRTIHPRRRSQGASEKSGHADHGRVAHCDRHRGAYAAVGGPEQPLRVDRGVCHMCVCGDRIYRRLHQSCASPQFGPDRAREAWACRLPPAS